MSIVTHFREKNVKNKKRCWKSCDLNLMCENKWNLIVMKTNDWLVTADWYWCICFCRGTLEKLVRLAALDLQDKGQVLFLFTFVMSNIFLLLSQSHNMFPVGSEWKKWRGRCCWPTRSSCELDTCLPFFLFLHLICIITIFVLFGLF